LSGSADGKQLTFLKQTDQGQVYLGELTAGGTHMNPPRRLTNDEAYDAPAAWTPDSKAVLFVSIRNGTAGIFRQEIGQDSAEPVVAGPDAVLPRLSPDGTWMLYRERPRTASRSSSERLMRVPVGGGAPQFVMDVHDVYDFRCARAPASLCLIFEGSQDEKQFTVTAFDPLKGRGKLLKTIPSPMVDLSPDGSTLAMSKPDEAEIHIRLLSLTGGSDREITLKGWPNVSSLDWAPAGKGFYVGSVSLQGYALLYVDLKGNAQVLWQYTGTGQIWGVPSPDGRYLAIAGFATNSNVWMLEGF
jgi:Tol biopolymer transport system component